MECQKTELGRAGRDGEQSQATILFRRGDMSHANAWILNNLSNKDRCEQILSGFAESWRYVNGHLAGICRRRIILDLFSEKDTPASALGDCCDVCKSTSNFSDRIKGPH